MCLVPWPRAVLIHGSFRISHPLFLIPLPEVIWQPRTPQTLEKRCLHSDRTGLSWPHTWTEDVGRREEPPVSSLERGHAVKGQHKVWEQGTCPSPSASSHSQPGCVLLTFGKVCMPLPSLKVTLLGHTAQCFPSHTDQAMEKDFSVFQLQLGLGRFQRTLQNQHKQIHSLQVFKGRWHTVDTLKLPKRLQKFPLRCGTLKNGYCNHIFPSQQHSLHSQWLVFEIKRNIEEHHHLSPWNTWFLGAPQSLRHLETKTCAGHWGKIETRSYKLPRGLLTSQAYSYSQHHHFIMIRGCKATVVLNITAFSTKKGA